MAKAALHPHANDALNRLRQEVQRLHRHQGEPSVREIARRTRAITHSTVHAVLQCAKTPRWGPLELVVEALGGSSEEFRRLWVAVREVEDGTPQSDPTQVGEVDLPDWGDHLAADTLPPDRIGHEYFVQELQRLRLAEDQVGARLVLAPVLSQVSTLAKVRARSSGRIHDALLRVESEWSQFCGWLYQDLGDLAGSEQWYARALSEAHETGDDNMVASLLSMRANAAWERRDAHRCIALSKAACRVTTTSPGVRALSMQQLARGYALAGDRAGCEHTFDEAAYLSARVADAPDQEPPWIYYQTPIRLQVQRAMCYRDLGLFRKAVDLLTQAITELPATYRRDRGQYLARLAVTLAQAGEPEQAAIAATEAQQLASTTGSARTLRELDRLPTLGTLCASEWR